ncbi:hypothetical protein [Sphingomonas carotinifaciens]|uniref:Uncharacterized protein n=1 Tax=Sphingomonas carotinifaciens TaxID=1166323 RepID=A0A1G7PYP5_9SPHN|nr:hypothetical protein [Sphingomonas carotinifaciens]MBB4087563.1 hypothetical protein [Sphingomonas carotinifaciens]MWC45646.1 hypothetical protein [Sphingomonas carotinifaciens]SDF91351.1 hypothetical protein SAMN05216557_107137 [Sphingomonas carotinifaciens]
MRVEILLALAFNAVMAAVLILALIRGGRPERLGVLVNIAGFALTSAMRLLSSAVVWAPGHGQTLLVDLGVTIGFFWLGITTTRFWPIWAAGFALGDLFMSLFGALLPKVSIFAYHTGMGIYAYLALGALALGTLRLPRDAEPYLRNGSRQSWIQHHRTTT